LGVVTEFVTKSVDELTNRSQRPSWLSIGLEQALLQPPVPNLFRLSSRFVPVAMSRT